MTYSIVEEEIRLDVCKREYIFRGIDLCLLSVYGTGYNPWFARYDIVLKSLMEHLVIKQIVIKQNLWPDRKFAICEVFYSPRGLPLITIPINDPKNYKLPTK